MSISSEIRRAGPFAGNGSTVNFPFTFKVFTTAQVVVTRTVSGVDTTLTLTTDYTVSLNSNQDTSPGGTVTMLTAPASGQSITITSNVANLQPTVLANLGGFYPEVLNDSLDRATIQIQQLDERVDRALVIPVSSSGVATQLPAPSSSALIGWNPAGTALQNYNSTALGTTAYQYLHSITATAGQTVIVLPAPYVLAANAITVFLNGLRLDQAADWVETNTTTVTLTSALSLGDTVTVVVNLLAAVATTTITTATPEATAAQIADITHTTNTTSKTIGQLLWDTTNNRLLRASGAAPSSAWYVVGWNGSFITPA